VTGMQPSTGGFSRTSLERCRRPDVTECSLALAATGLVQVGVEGPTSSFC
jgi:hypothetical protein